MNDGDSVLDSKGDCAECGHLFYNGMGNKICWDCRKVAIADPLRCDECGVCSDDLNPDPYNNNGVYCAECLEDE